MATTEIHMIASTPEKALGYCMADKVEVLVSEDQINPDAQHEIFEQNGVKYVRYFTINSFQDVRQSEPLAVYFEKQEAFQGKRYKNDGSMTKNGKEPVMWHMHQSFDGWEVTPMVANEIGRKLAAEVFSGFSVTVSTHCNTENIHNHFIVSAWNNDGRKWDDCHRTKRLIREVSDRLCEEYGLNVLEHTRDMKLLKYKDENGVIRYYEPTDRKNRLIQMREDGEITPDDVNSYRNTVPYDEKEHRLMTNRDEVKKDIDTLLPSCRSYDELLMRLRELGYVINDKKKNGDWLSHVSFLAPGHDRATRDNKLGDGEFYLRENLTRYIAENAAKLVREPVSHYHRDEEFAALEVPGAPPIPIPYFEEYEYGKTKLSDIHDDFRTVREQDGSFHTVARTETEKKVLRDVRVKDSQVRGLIDTSQLDRLIAEQNNQRRQKKPYLTKTQEQRLVAEIQESFRCLRYTERHGIYGYQQIIDLYSANKAKYDKAVDDFTKAEVMVGQLRDALLAPQKLAELEAKMDLKRGDVKYILEEFSNDKKVAEQYRGTISKFKIGTPEGLQSLEQKVREFELRLDNNRLYMSGVIMQMSELENCIRTFDRIDSARGAKNVQAMQIFERIVREQETQEEKAQREKQRRGGIDHR